MTDAVDHSGRRTTTSMRTWTRTFPARPDQVGHARRFLTLALDDCPALDDVVLCVSELASNSVLHSASRMSGGSFTVRVEMERGSYVLIEVHDDGGSWDQRPPMDERLHGLAIVRELASDSGTRGSATTGWIAWARLEWPPTATAPAGDMRTPGNIARQALVALPIVFAAAIALHH